MIQPGIYTQYLILIAMAIILSTFNVQLLYGGFTIFILSKATDPFSQSAPQHTTALSWLSLQYSFNCTQSVPNTDQLLLQNSIFCTCSGHQEFQVMALD